jgi:hypothetical protein
MHTLEKKLNKYCLPIQSNLNGQELGGEMAEADMRMKNATATMKRQIGGEL